MIIFNETVIVSPTDDPGIVEALYPFQSPAGIQDDRCYQRQWSFNDTDASKRDQRAVTYIFP